MRQSRLPVLVLCLALGACATTRQTRGELWESGFLSDYSKLEPGGSGEATLLYVNPDADFSRYDAVEIESVTLWYTQRAHLRAEDQQLLTDHLYATLVESLTEQGFAIVEEPGPNVIKLRAAITEARGAKRVANAVTSIAPPARVLATLGGLATDTAVFVGRAGLEAEFRDGITEEQLMAGADERVGTKTVRGAFGKWTHVKAAFDVWSDRIAARLAELRASS